MLILEKIKKALRKKSLIVSLKRFFLVKIYSLRYSFANVDDYKVVCQNFDGRGFGCSPKYIVKALHSLNSEFDIVWLIDSTANFDSNLPDYVRSVDIRSVKAIKELSTAKFWISNCRSGVFYKVRKKSGQVYIQTWHGNFGPKKAEGFVEDLLPVSYVALAKADSKIIDFCVSNGHYNTTFYREKFWCNAQIWEIGCPRNDVLLNQKECELIRKNLNLKDEHVCLYAPTFRKDFGLGCYNIDFSRLKFSLEKKFGGTWRIAVRLHPNFFDKVYLLNLPDFVLDYTAYPDAQEILAVSDCVITDYSSIIYDFMFTKKPIFIYAADYDAYIKNDRSLNFELTDTPFPISKNNEELNASVENFSYDNYSHSINVFAEKYGVFELGNASDSVARKILEIAVSARKKRFF